MFGKGHEGNRPKMLQKKKVQDVDHAETISLARDLVSRGQFVGTKNLFVPYQN